jgi:exosortase A
MIRADGDAPIDRRDWLWLLALWASATVAYAGTLFDMASVWSNSRNYLHGWLILPICAWLLWRERGRLRGVAPRASSLGLLACFLAVAAWIPAQALQINVISQFAFVGLLVATLWAAWGGTALRVLWFPAAFAMLAVPFSEGFVPALMEWTATATIALLRFTGYFVVREGLFFSTVAGDFAVAEACSGVRYLTITVTAAALFAYLQFASLRYRLGFVLLAIVISLVGNVLRAYGLVVIGHTFGMESAAGIDHFIHGTVFFGVLLIVLFGAGAWLARREPRTADAEVSGDTGTRSCTRGRRWLPVWLGIMLLGPVAALALQSSERTALPARPTIADIGEWRALPPEPDCGPFAIANRSSIECRTFEHPRLGQFRVAIVSGGSRAEALDLLATENRVTRPTAWRLVSQRARRIATDIVVTESVQESLQDTRRLRSWHEYRFGHRTAPNRRAVALPYLFARMTGDPRLPLLLVITTAERPDADAALADFAPRWLEAVGATQKRD